MPPWIHTTVTPPNKQVRPEILAQTSFCWQFALPLSLYLEQYALQWLTLNVAYVNATTTYFLTGRLALALNNVTWSIKVWKLFHLLSMRCFQCLSVHALYGAAQQPLKLTVRMWLCNESKIYARKKTASTIQTIETVSAAAAAAAAATATAAATTDMAQQSWVGSAVSCIKSTSTHTLPLGWLYSTSCTKVRHVLLKHCASSFA